MSGEFIIELGDLWFYSFHGLYEEERRSGGEFIVDLYVKVKSENKTITNLKETLNYVSLYEIVKQEMNKPQSLLETVATLIAEKIHHKFSALKEIEIRITKKNPPITGFSGSVAVKYKKEF